jgi:hypothetical protein
MVEREDMREGELDVGERVIKTPRVEEKNTQRNLG